TQARVAPSRLWMISTTIPSRTSAPARPAMARLLARRRPGPAAYKKAGPSACSARRRARGRFAAVTLSSPVTPAKPPPAIAPGPPLRAGTVPLAGPLLGRLRRRQQVLAGEVDPAEGVDVGDHHRELVADVDHVFHPADPLVGVLGDVHQALLAGQDLDEGAEVHDPLHLAGVDGAHFNVPGQRLDHGHGLL